MSPNNLRNTDIRNDGTGIGKLLSGCVMEILEIADECVTLHSADLRILWCNGRASSIIGPASGAAETAPCHKTIYGNAKRCENCPAEKTLESRKFETGVVRSAAGGLYEVRSLPVIDTEGDIRGVLEFSREVKAPVKQPDASAESTSLGQLAAGIAHEINNPINGIINYAQILANRLPQDEPERRIASSIITEGERIAGIVQGLLTFAGHGEKNKRQASLFEVLYDCLSLSHAQMKQDGIHLVIRLEPELPNMFLNVSQMRQVFLNILNNARFALNQRYPAPDENKILRIDGKGIVRDSHKFIRIEFMDKGTGIPQEIKGNVLSPFFSTRSGGTGTGLGLSMSRNIVMQHRGSIDVDSVSGDYTKVTVELPCLEEGNG